MTMMGACVFIPAGGVRVVSIKGRPPPPLRPATEKNGGRIHGTLALVVHSLP